MNEYNLDNIKKNKSIKSNIKKYLIKKEKKEPKIIYWVNEPKINANLSIDNLPEWWSLLDYFIWVTSHSSPDWTETQLTIVSTESTNNTSMLSWNTIVIQKDWVYQINASTSWGTNWTWVRNMTIEKNWVRVDFGRANPSSTSLTFLNMSTAIYCIVWDVIDVRVFQNSWVTLSNWSDWNKLSVLQI